ncbi:olfactory receptor 2G3-like [Dendropsophus ebraccatus]|uniref:olfactory receptor 2G3-like n=1 Tax=Dendropsophus ebraccatus TaxID=150705 RepID=UPI0038314594
MKYQDTYNGSDFIIQGFSDIPKLQVPLFWIFLFLCFLIICGNLTLIVLIYKTPHLHTPMYVFLVNFSVIDIASTSNTLPKLLATLCTKPKTISVAGCITQMYIFMSLSCTEVILLAAMAYDQYVAICHPLHYFVLMPIRRCAGLSFISWFVGFLDPTGHAALISKMSFCLNNLIDHFFCDINSLLLVACSDASIVNMLNYIEGTILGITAFSFTLVSYIFIISAILRIKSNEGQRKAFSTCTAHLTCVTFFYGTLISLYMRPRSSLPPKQDKFFSLLHIVLVPMVNPIIYSLKNKDFKTVLVKMKKTFF